MKFAFSEEQDQLREAVRKFLEAKSPETEVRRLMETTEGYDPAVWQQMANELGLQSLAIPEEYGGQGYTLRRARRSCSRSRAARCCARRTSRPSCSRRTRPERRRRGRRRRCSRASREARPSPRWRSPRPNGRWDAGGITLEAQGRRRRLHARRHQDVRARRPHRRPHRRRPAPRGPGEDGIRSSPSPATPRA